MLRYLHTANIYFVTDSEKQNSQWGIFFMNLKIALRMKISFYNRHKWKHFLHTRKHNLMKASTFKNEKRQKGNFNKFSRLRVNSFKFIDILTQIYISSFQNVLHVNRPSKIFKHKNYLKLNAFFFMLVFLLCLTRLP